MGGLILEAGRVSSCATSARLKALAHRTAHLAGSKLRECFTCALRSLSCLVRHARRSSTRAALGCSWQGANQIRHPACTNSMLRAETTFGSAWHCASLLVLSLSGCAKASAASKLVGAILAGVSLRGAHHMPSWHLQCHAPASP